jgi:hypothetical protein
MPTDQATLSTLARAEVFDLNDGPDGGNAVHGPVVDEVRCRQQGLQAPNSRSQDHFLFLDLEVVVIASGLAERACFLQTTGHAHFELVT